MNSVKVGQLILSLRKERNMTQKAVADKMNISDKAISKWERGLGCPDITLLGDLSHIFGVDIEQILQGELKTNSIDIGNMKRIKFYVCASCGNILNSTTEATIYCCGRKSSPLTAKKTVDEEHKLSIVEVENDYYITIQHEMTKKHYISFVAIVAYDRVLTVKLYPEQNAELRVPKMRGSKVYAYCSQHGLWTMAKE